MLRAAPGHAAHPLVTEDTGTQGRGGFELELGTSLVHQGDASIFELDPQLSYGAADALDLIVRPALLALRGEAAQDAARHFGAGATALDFKWRFLEHGAWSVGTRAGLDLPALSHDLGPRRTGAHALLAVTYDAPLWVSGNVAYTHRPAVADGEPQVRHDVWRVSLALAHAPTERVRLVADVAAAEADDPRVGGLPAVAVLGAIFKLAEGLDADIGYQARLSRNAAPAAWLAGLTLRW